MVDEYTKLVDSIFAGKDLSDPADADAAFGTLHSEALLRFGLQGLINIYAERLQNEEWMRSISYIHTGAFYNNVGWALMQEVQGPRSIIAALGYFFTALDEDAKLGRTESTTAVRNIQSVVNTALDNLLQLGPMSRSDILLDLVHILNTAF